MDWKNTSKSQVNHILIANRHNKVYKQIIFYLIVILFNSPCWLVSYQQVICQISAHIPIHIIINDVTCLIVEFSASFVIFTHSKYITINTKVFNSIYFILILYFQHLQFDSHYLVASGYIQIHEIWHMLGHFPCILYGARQIQVVDVKRIK